MSMQSILFTVYRIALLFLNDCPGGGLKELSLINLEQVTTEGELSVNTCYT